MGAMEKSTHTPEYCTLRSELRMMRASAGLSQRDLAQRLSVPHSWVAKVESGERRIDPVEFYWFMLACEIDPLVASERLVRKWRTLPIRRHSKKGRSQ
jgi:transcriptional regulator with XRE-family HTH domain